MSVVLFFPFGPVLGPIAIVMGRNARRRAMGGASGKGLATAGVVLDVEPVMIPVDTSKLERILENLLANSVRHTPAGTDIWIRTRAKEGGALIVVEDDGPGVPEELREAIFEPFRQGPSNSQHSPGAGVGLALVARFAELHRGRAWVEERPGGGASFHVWLPGRQVPQRRPGDRSVGG